MQAECLAGVPMIMGTSCRTPLISVPFFYIMALFSNAQNVPVPMKAVSGLLECTSFSKNRTRPVKTDWHLRCQAVSLSVRGFQGQYVRMYCSIITLFYL